MKLQAITLIGIFKSECTRSKRSLDGVIPSRSSLEHNSILSAPLDSTKAASSYESTQTSFIICI